MTYLTHDIPVDGGLLRVGEWRPDAALHPTPDAPTIVALHGMTGSHLAWQWLAAQMPEARIIAPDLRGRGRSAELPPPYGVSAHVDDVMAMLAALRLVPGAARNTSVDALTVDPHGGSPLVIVGHSLGAFVALAAIHRHPAVFSRGVFLDGGLPVTVPLNIEDDDLLEAVLGVAVAHRTELTFSSRPIYQKFWKMHPGLAPAWSDELVRMADYDLTEVLAEDGSVHYRPVAARDAIETDARELYGSHTTRAQLDALGASGPALQVPITVLTAQRGLLNELPGVYSERELYRWRTELPFLNFVDVPRVNHYGLVFTPRGATAIATELRRTLVGAR